MSHCNNTSIEKLVSYALELFCDKERRLESTTYFSLCFCGFYVAMELFAHSKNLDRYIL